MPSHQRDEVISAILPTPHEIAIAGEAITGALGAGRLSTDMLLEKVIERMGPEPFPDASHIELVAADELKRARAIGCLVLALAHLESTGHVLPYGSRSFKSWQQIEIKYRSDRNPSGYRVDPFNFELADVYVLPLNGLAPQVDTPALLLDRLPARMGAKVRRVLAEAAATYRSGQFVGAAMLLGTASEAAWEQVALVAASLAGDAKLDKLIADPLSSAAQVEGAALKAIAALNVTKGATLASLDATARAYRELRNHAVHEPEESFDEQLFSWSVIGTLISGAVPYFRQLYELMDRLADGP